MNSNTEEEEAGRKRRKRGKPSKEKRQRNNRRKAARKQQLKQAAAKLSAFDICDQYNINIISNSINVGIDANINRAGGEFQRDERTGMKDLVPPPRFPADKNRFSLKNALHNVQPFTSRRRLKK